MPLDPRITGLLRREFLTIRTLRDPRLKNALGAIRGEVGQRGLLNSSIRVTKVDQRCAEEYRERAADYLQKLLGRLSELRIPWTEGLRAEMEQLLLEELGKDWNWLLNYRDSELGADLAKDGKGLIAEAQTTAHRLIEEELAFQVLREERHKLPLIELLSTPRYLVVLQHWSAAQEQFSSRPPHTEGTVRETIMAVEALGRLATRSSSATLGEVLQKLRLRTDDAAKHLMSCIEKLWNFSNTAPSTRHGGGTGDPVSIPEAQMLLEAGGAALRYLLLFDLDA